MTDVQLPPLPPGLASMGPFAPLQQIWRPITRIVQNQLLVANGQSWICNTTHVSRSTFDAIEQALFTSVGGGGGGGGGSLAVTSIPAAGAAQAIAQGGVTTLIVDMTLSAPVCTITITGWPAAGTYGEVLFRIHQDNITTGRVPGLGFVTLWNGIYPPVMPTILQGTLEFTAFSIDAGASIVGIHGQPVRWHTGRIITPADNTLSKDLEYFDYDARIVLMRMSTGGTPVTNPALFDLFLGTNNGGGATTYGTNPGNRPAVAAGNLTSGALALPDTTAIAPGQYLQPKCVTASSSTNAAMKIMCVEAA